MSLESKVLCELVEVANMQHVSERRRPSAQQNGTSSINTNLAATRRGESNEPAHIA